MANAQKKLSGFFGARNNELGCPSVDDNLLVDNTLFDVLT